ncbi:right-handed parallel beta-helix repeat-containing protein [bacterium]|nr:right-handed parallel beta-helix repeat-containing protein [bacterium]
MMRLVMMIFLFAAVFAAPGYCQTVAVDALLGNDGTGVPAYQTLQAAVNAVLANPATPDVINLNTNAPHIQTAIVQIPVVGGNLTLQGTAGRIATIVGANFTNTVDLVNQGAIICSATNSTILFKDFVLIPPPASIVGTGGAVGGDGNGMNGLVLHTDSNNSTVTCRNVVVTGNNNANQPTSLDGSADLTSNPNATYWPGACLRFNANVGMNYNFENCVLSQSADQGLNVNQNISGATTAVGPVVVMSGTGRYTYCENGPLYFNAGSLTVQGSGPRAIELFHPGLSTGDSAIVIHKAATVLLQNIWIHDFGATTGNRGVYVLGVGGHNTLTMRNCELTRVSGTVVRTAFNLPNPTQMEGASWLIEDCTFEESAQQGFYDANSLTVAGPSPASIIFRRCTFRNNAANGIRPRTWRNTLVQDCWFFNNGKQNALAATLGLNYETAFDNGTQCFIDMESIGRTDTVGTLERCKFEDGGNYGCYVFAFNSTIRNCLSIFNGGPGIGAGSRNGRADVILIEDSTSAFDADNPTFTGAIETRLCAVATRGNDITFRRLYVEGSPLNGIFTLSESYRNNELNRLENVTIVNCASTAVRLENATTELENCLFFNNLGAGLRKQVNAGDVSTPSQANGPITINGCLFQQCTDGGVTTDFNINGITTINNSIFRNNGGYGADLTSCTARINECTFISNATAGVRIGRGPGPNAILDYVRNSVFLDNAQAGVYVGEAAGAAVGTVTNCTILGSNDGIHVEGIGITAPITVSDCIIGGAGKTGIFADSFLFTPGITVSHSSLILSGVHALAAVENDAGNFVTLTASVINSDPLFLNANNPDGANFFDVDSSYFGDKGSGTPPMPLRGGAAYLGGTVEIGAWRLF